MRAQAEESNAASAAALRQAHTEIDDARRRYESSMMPDLRSVHAQTVADLQAAREGRARQAALDAAYDAIQPLLASMPPDVAPDGGGDAVPTGSPGSRLSTSAAAAAISTASAGQPGSHLGTVVAGAERLCALVSELRAALRVSEAAEEALRAELSASRVKIEVLADEVAAHVAREAELALGLDSARKGRAAADSTASELAAEVKGLREAAQLAEEQRHRARSEELMLLERRWRRRSRRLCSATRPTWLRCRRSSPRHDSRSKRRTRGMTKSLQDFVPNLRRRGVR